MKTEKIQFRRNLRIWLSFILTFVILFTPAISSAAALSPRNAIVGSNAPGASTTYTANFTTATASVLGSIGFQFCSTPTGACVLPAGVITTGSTVMAQFGATGFAMDDTTNGAPYLTRNPAFVGGSVQLSYKLGNFTNPTTPDLEYYLRITTYSGSDGTTGPVDSGSVAMSTNEPVVLTGVTPEILIFCVGTSIAGNCTTVSGSTLDFGDFSPVATQDGTSVMQAQTNASGGYVITVTGTTLSSGVNTIPALAAPGGSIVGKSQFGLNLRANSNPAVGADPSGIGSGVYAGNYGTADQYMFQSGDTVATAGSPTDANTFTSSYIVNIGGSQAAGVYTATMTYICTAAF